ncbi:MAG: tryptophan transporter [Clostridiaceae bacterium]
MNVKKMTLSALLISIGYVLHQIVPGIPFLGGMKMDFLLVMMFFSIFMMDSYKEVFAVSLVCGLISAMTTTFPGGQVANVVDKLVTGAVIYMLFRALEGKMNNTVRLGLLACIGTILSGTVFLLTGLAISGVELSFLDLFIAIVLPTSALNTVLAVFLEKIILRSGYTLSEKKLAQ